MIPGHTLVHLIIPTPSLANFFQDRYIVCKYGVVLQTADFKYKSLVLTLARESTLALTHGTCHG